jgi:hypothetical protein
MKGRANRAALFFGELQMPGLRFSDNCFSDPGVSEDLDDESELHSAAAAIGDFCWNPPRRHEYWPH